MLSYIVLLLMFEVSYTQIKSYEESVKKINKFNNRNPNRLIW